MTISDYPSGFEAGVLLRGLLNPETTTGTNFYVGNHSTLLQNERGASDGNKGTFLSPFSTIEKAINSTNSGNNDRIYIRPGHTLSITSATTLVADSNGVQIIGMGQGEDRPIITYTTATAAAIPVSANNLVMANIIHKCNIASQTHMLDLTGTSGLYVNCSFREGSATGLSFITADGSDADIDRTRFVGCDFFAPTAGNYDNAIELANDFTNVKFIDCYVYGDFDTAGLSVPAGGNAQVNLQILGGEYVNLKTGVGAIVINGTGSSGTIRDVLIKTDTEVGSLDSGSLAVDNVTWASTTTDQVSSTPIFPEADSASNIHGADDSNNLFASTNVVANIDGSLIERVEALMDPLGGYDPVLGFRVLKTATLASSPDALFTVDGRCLITLVTGELTTNVATTTTMLLADVTNSINLCAATTITGDTVGTLYVLSGVKADVLNGGIAPVIGSASVANGSFVPLIIGDAQAAITIQHTLSGAGTGIVVWSLYYKPLIAGATVVAAA